MRCKGGQGFKKTMAFFEVGDRRRLESVRVTLFCARSVVNRVCKECNAARGELAERMLIDDEIRSQ